MSESEPSSSLDSARALKKTIYVGTFLSCSASDPTKLNVLENSVIGVDEAGKIAFIEPNVVQNGSLGEDMDVALEITKRKLGWVGAKTVLIPTGRVGRVGFWFPGFIGESHGFPGV